MKLQRMDQIFFNAYSCGPHTHYSFPGILTSTYPFMFNGPKIDMNRETISNILKKKWI